VSDQAAALLGAADDRSHEDADLAPHIQQGRGVSDFE
jgi:hypothetical protein